LLRNRALRKILGPKIEQVVGYWRKFHSEELQNLHFPTTSTQVMKSRMLRWVRRVASMGEKRCMQDFSIETQRKRIFGRLGTDEAYY
jgi:hypothetical protein